MYNFDDSCKADAHAENLMTLTKGVEVLNRAGHYLNHLRQSGRRESPGAFRHDSRPEVFKRTPTTFSRCRLMPMTYPALSLSA